MCRFVPSFPACARSGGRVSLASLMIMGVLAQSSAPVRNLDPLASRDRHDRDPEIDDRINASLGK
jgi:hypothetical protein